MSALSSLLVRDDVVSIQRIEDALQRQVLEGGDIDTALLELNAAPENVINSYRAALFGVPAASRHHLMGQEPHTLLAVPREVAERYRIVPLWLDQNVLVLAVATPPSERVMNEIHALLNMRLAIRIATEMRIEAALAVHYGIVIPGRLRQLAEQLEKHDPGVLRPVAPLRSTTRPPPRMDSDLPPAVTTLVSRSIGAPVPDQAPEDASRPRRPPAVLATVPGGFLDPNTAPFAAAPVASTPVRAPTQTYEAQTSAAPHPVHPLPEDWRKRTLPSGSLSGPTPGVVTRASSVPPPPQAAMPPPQAVMAPIASDETSDREPTQRVSYRPPAVATPTPPPMRRPRSRSVSSLRGPLTREKADQLLDKAEDRNAIIEVFFAYARQYFDCAAMFSMREDRAVGLETYGLAGIGDIRAVSVPLEKTGTLDDVARSLLPRVADLSRRPADRRLASVLGRLSAQPAAVVPISLRQRVVLFLYGDRSGESFELDSLSDLIEFVPAVSRAFERVIRTSKLLAAGALTAMREEEEAAAAASLPPPVPVPVLEPSAAVAEAARPDFARAATIQAIPAWAPPRDTHEPHTIRALIPPVADPVTRDALSTLGIGRNAPPPPSPEAARRAAISETDIETRATQQIRAQSPLPPKPEPSRPPSRPNDTYSLLSGKPADATNSYSLQDAVSDVLKTSRSEPPPRPKRSVDHVSPAPQPSARPGAHVQSSAALVPKKVDTVRPVRTDARREDGQATWSTEVVKLPGKPISSPPRSEARTSDPPQRTSDPPQRTSDPPQRISDPAPAARAVSDTGLELDGLLRDLCSSGPDDEAPFVNALVRLGDAALPAVVQRFPGPLWFDRSEPFQRLPPGRDVSAAARALYAFGETSLPYLMQLLAAPNPDLRFYALLLAADIRAEGLVIGLVPLLSDSDPQVKDLARTLLLRLRHLPSFHHVLEELRGAVVLDRLPAESRIDALHILGSLRDASSVDVLVLAMSASDHRVANTAHDTLRTLTGQDCGNSPRKWQAWFAEHGKEDRVEWLIEGLMHNDEAVRTIAGNELQRATQQYFGFHPGSPKKERERVQKKYREWRSSKKG